MERNTILIREKFIDYFKSTFALTLSMYAASLCDGIMVGRFLGANALSVVSLSAPVTYIINIIISLLVYGGSTLTAQYLGQRHRQKANTIFTMVIMIGTIIMSIMAVIGIVGARYQAVLIANGTDLIEGLHAYLIPLWLNAPLLLTINSMASFVQLDNHIYLSRALPIVANVINLICDYIYIRCFHWGIGGAGWATVTGYALGSLLLLYYRYSSKRQFHFVSYHLIQRQDLIDTIKIGNANAMIFFSNAISTFIVNRLIIRAQGTAGTQIVAICLIAFTFGMMCIDAASQALMVLSGTFYGEQDYNGLRRLFRFALLATLGINVLTMMLFMINPDIIARLFVLDGAHILTFRYAFRLYITCLPCYGFVYILRAFYQSTKQEQAATLLSLLDGLIIIVPIMALCAYFAPDLIWLSFSLSEIISALIVIIIMSLKAKREGRDNALMLLPVPGDTFEMTTSNSYKGAVNASSTIMQFCREHDLSPRLCHIIGVTVEELCINAYSHDYPTYSDVFLKIGKDIILKIRDNGQPFNPTEFMNDEGDMITGIELIRSLPTEISYQYIIGFNVTIVKISQS